MNIEKLEVGQTFKNYKELCAVLGWEIKVSANSKNAQLKELARFCKYNKIGHKFTIEEVYTDPIDKVENRGKSEGSRNNNSVYGEMIQLLILDLLARCKEGKTTISRGKLLFVIDMINGNYRYCSENVRSLSKYTDIDEQVIYDFYNTTNSNFKSTVETALRNLMDKRIIWYDVVTKISEKGTDRHRLATKEEIEYIMLCEKKILDELGYKQVSLVRISKHWKLFKTKVKELFEDTLINYYYQAYDIVINEEYLQQERKELRDLILETCERDGYKDELNLTVQENLMKNAQKRHEKAFTSRKMGKFRMKEKYIDDMNKLIELLINNDSKSILDDIFNVELETSLSDQIERELETLFA